MKFRIELAESAVEDLQWFKRYERVLILDEIDKHLLYEPALETRNRKSLSENINVNETDGIVDITAVGYKEHGKLFFRGKGVKI